MSHPLVSAHQDAITYRWLSLINVASLILMGIHDLDHVRVAMIRGYELTGTNLLTFSVAYVPNLLALMLTRRRSQHASLATAVAGVVVFLGYIAFHLFGAACISDVFDFRPWLGIWVSSYPTLQVDTISWVLLTLNMAGAAMSVVAASVKALGPWLSPDQRLGSAAR